MTGPFDIVARESDETVRYGSAPEQIAELYRAPGAADRGELVVFVHGGFWRNRYDRSHARPLAAALAEAGWTVLLPEYRRLGDRGGGVPGTFDDIVALIAAVPSLVPSELRRRVTLVGHSAGGHLAVWSQASAPSPVIDAVVSLAGVLDLDAGEAEALSEGIVGELLTGADAEARRSADPMLLPTPPVPVLLVHGADDAEVPAGYSRRYAHEHPGAELLELPTIGHFELIDPRTPAFAAWRARL